MKSVIKYDLKTPVQFIKGIGPKRAEAFANRGINTVHDLLYYFPFDYFDLTQVSEISSLRHLTDTAKRISVIGTIRAIDIAGRPPRRKCVITLGDATGTISLVFFQNANYFKSAFEVGEMLAVSGKLNFFQNRPQFVHPRIDRLEGNNEDNLKGFLHTKGIIPKYSSGEDFRNLRITDTVFRKIMKEVVDNFAEQAEEFFPENFLSRLNLLPLSVALRNIHFPETVEYKNASRYRLKFDEWFCFQLLLAYRKMKTKVQTPGIPFNVKSNLARKLVDSLQFKLTKAQIKVVKEIANDMSQPKQMNRLLQGDVGSGKTVVALIAMLIAIDNGYQVAFMAPTEILAEQHYKTITYFLKDVNVNTRLLIGGQRKKLKEDILGDIKSGGANIIVGTHALIQENVEFANLGFVVIDEQHRFGVDQRADLVRKGIESVNVHPDVLVMTATPIPRTLALTVYGDLDVSIIDEMPKNRKPIKTLMIAEAESERLYAMIRATVSKGQQVYIIYPLIEESEKQDLKAAVESYEMFRDTIFTDLKVGLIHGRMSSDEKDQIMEAFKAKHLHILVSTTVIEVGIDIPNATMMVIEHAERFGLSQLHQLRGRVGRGAEQSHCVLVVPDWLARLTKRQTENKIMLDSPNSNNINELERQKILTRIQTMLATNDGFKISEVDLMLRGPGDFFGTRQSGLPELHIANVLEDGPIITIARREAFRLVADDPHLRNQEHQSLRKYFFEKLKTSLNYMNVG